MMRTSATVVGTQELARRAYIEEGVFDLVKAVREGRLALTALEACQLLGVDLEEFSRAYGALLAKGRIDLPVSPA